MAFRDDHEALRTRIAALEEELTAVNAQLEASRKSAKKKGSLGPGVARWIFIALGFAAAAIAYFLAYGVSGYNAEVAGIAALAIGVVLVMLGAVIGQMEIAAPDEALILIGRPSNLADGSKAGFTIVTAGRALRIPFLERTERVSLQPVWVDGALDDVRSTKGTLRLRYRARVEIERGPDMRHAVERFVGQPPEAIRTSVEHTIEGALRGVAAHMSAEHIADDVFRVADRTREEMEDELRRLGLSIPSFRLISVELDPTYSGPHSH
jgi:uncharacterized membrane protein YqiK